MCGITSGTIRGDYALAVGRNVCHGSDSVESAHKEIKLFVLVITISL
jgi:nucleoside diphosphate kinase